MTETIAFETTEDPLASVIVLAWKSAPYLLNCLTALRTSVRGIAYELVLVLNEPSRELQTTVERFVRGAVVVRSRVNLGFGGAMNLGARHARGRYLVLLNDDTEVLSDWLETLVETAERRPAAHAVGSTALFFDDSIQEAGCVVWSDGSTVKVGRDLPVGSKRYDYERKVDFCSGGSLLIRKESWDRLGGMEADTYYPAYYEDTDFCLRIVTELGGEVWYQPRSFVRHHESVATDATFRAFLFHRNRTILAARWSEELQRHDPPAPTDLAAIERAQWRAAGAKKRLLLIDDQVADPSIGSGYPRMFEAMNELIGLGFELSIFTSLVEGAQHTDAMCRLGVRVLEGSFEDELAAELDGLAVGFDAVVISRPHNYLRFAPIARAAMPNVPVIYDAEALFHRRLFRQSELVTEEEARFALGTEASAMRASEAWIAADADGLVAISNEEAAFLAEHTSVPIEIHGPLLAGVQPDPACFGARGDIGFVAGWAGGPTSPNADALRWFCREVLPLVAARLPGARLFVTGINPPEEALRFAGDSVVFLGGLENLAAFYSEIRVIVVPMRYGAGVKNKTIEALQYGVPTVSTTVGAEGVPLDDPEVLLVDDDPRGFALKVAGLLGDQGTWELYRHRILTQHQRWQRSESVWPGVIEAAISRRARASLDSAVASHIMDTPSRLLR